MYCIEDGVILGMGIDTSLVKWDLNKVKEALKETRMLSKAVNSWIKPDKLEDIHNINYFEDWVSFTETCSGVNALILDLLYEVEHYDFRIINAQDKDFLIFPAKMPWQLSNVEAKIKTETLIEIFKKYVTDDTTVVLKDFYFSKERT